MTPSRVFAILAAAVFCACGKTTPAPKPAKPSAPAHAALASLAQAQGEVSRTPKGGARVPGKPGDALYEGDAVDTGAGASATLQFPGRTVELGELGRIVIGAGKDGAVSVELASGIIVSRTEEAAGSQPSIELEVLTPVGITRIGSDGKPSAVSLTAKEGKAELQVLLGTISVVARGANGEQTTRVSAGERLELALGTITLVRPQEQKVEASLDVSGITIVREPKHRPKRLSGGHQVLASGSEVQVVSGGSALHLGALQARLTKGDRLKLGDSSDGLRKLDLRSGMVEFTSSANGGASSALQLGETTLRPEGEAQWLVTSARGKRTVDVLTGQVELTRGNQKVALQPGEQAELAARKLVASEGRGPELVVYGGHRTVYGISAIDRMAIGWPSSACSGSCRVEVASDPSFSQMLVRGPVEKPMVEVPARRGMLYWRVTAAGKPVANGQVTCAEERLGGEHLSNPHNDVLDNGVKTVVYFQSKLPAITLSWKPAEKAARYRVRVFPAERLGTPAVDREVSEPRLQLTAGQISEGSFFWSQTPLDALGKELTGGRMNPLEIAYDNSVPVLAILAPRPRQSVGRSTRLSAIAPLGSRVSLEGKPLPIDIKGRIEKQIAVPRSGLLVFRVERGGAEEIYLRRVRVH